MALFCIDFDYTITNGHTHNNIMMHVVKDRKVENDQEAQWNIVKNISPIAKAEEWKEVFEQLNREGHEVAIVSFSAFGHIIPRYLKEVIGLSDELIKKITVVSSLPDKPESSDKSAHISDVIAETKADVKNPQNVVLIDDSKQNIQGAKMKGYRTITANSTGSHLLEIKNLSTLLAKNINKPKSNKFSLFKKPETQSGYVRLADLKNDDSSKCCGCFC